MTSGYIDRPSDDVGSLIDKRPINGWRVLLAFILTPLIISLAVAVAMPLYAGNPNYLERVLRTSFVYFLYGALPPTIVFGAPAFLLLRKLVRPTLLNCAAVGAVIAALPWFLLGLLSGADQASTGGRATIINGRYTAYGWLDFGEFLLMTAAAGAVGGAIFWAIAAARLQKQFR